ncbi:hypothetical protein KAW18_11665 [candidate division WOR-3 bacterium]|nr:hypothetical protein [candidate division WOR-3 bacterium]
MVEDTVNEEPGILDPTVCPNPAIDAVRSVFGAVGKDITCDRAKGYLLLAGVVIVGIIILKVFVLGRR